MQTIKTYRKVGAFYIVCEADLSTPIQYWVSSKQKLSGSEPSWSLGRAIRLQSSSLVASYVACLIQNDSGFWVFGGIRSVRFNFLRKRRDSMKKRGWLPLEIR
jgi:hypothetical protein